VGSVHGGAVIASPFAFTLYQVGNTPMLGQFATGPLSRYDARAIADRATERTHQWYYKASYSTRSQRQVLGVEAYLSDNWR